MMKPTRVLVNVAAMLLILVLVQGVQAAGYNYVTQWGTSGTGNGQFGYLSPQGIAVNGSGYVYAMDTYNDRIQVFTSNGAYEFKFGSLTQPEGITIDSLGTVFITDTHAGNIQKFIPAGALLQKWSTYANFMNAVSVNRTNAIVYVAGAGDTFYGFTDRIYKFASDGTLIKTWGSEGSDPGELNRPHGIVVNKTDYVYVSDTNNNRIQIFDKDGTFKSLWGSFGSGDGQFNSPQHIAVNASDYVFVVDRSNSRIQVFGPSGQYETQWGSAGTGNGQFSSPDGIAVDSNDDIYVTDSGNNRIQKFTQATPGWKFHADERNTGVYHDTSGITPVNNIKWNFQTDGEVYSSPAVAEGVVYIGSKYVYALDAATGAKLWQKQLGDVIYSSPAVVNNIIYIGCDDGKVYALDAATGSEIWNFNAGGMYGVRSSPTFWNNTVYVGTAGMGTSKVYALDAYDGHKKWENTTGDGIYSSPAVANGMVYVGSYDHKVYAWEANLGIEKWEFMTGDAVSSSPAVDNGVVYVGSWDKKVYALDAYDGHKVWDVLTGNTVLSSPAIANGVVYVGSLDAYVYALDAYNNGAQLWQKQLGGVIYSSPAVANGVVYIGSADNKVYALDAATGAKKWDVTTGASIFDSSPAVANGVVYIGSTDGKVYALGGIPPPTVSSVTPASGANTGTVHVEITGTGFVDGATVKLTKSGQADITATNVLWVSATQITCDLPITGADLGPWDVVVTNPDSQFGTLAGGFTVTPEPITCPAIISAPGVYELQNDCANTPFAHPWDGIKITSSDVVFDGMGHTIDGFDDSGWGMVHGIYASGAFGAPLSNIHVKNVTVNGTYQGIYYYVADGGVIEDITGRNNYIGSVFLHFSNYTMVKDCTATNDGDIGISVWDGSNSNTITNNVANNNEVGFGISYGKNNIVMDNTFENNHIGIDLLEGDSPNNQIIRNVIRYNDGYGIQSDKTGDNTFPTVIYNNYFFNEFNTKFVGFPRVNIWNTTKTPGTNIIGGSYIGGNYWANASGTEFSQTCTDAGDGICDSPYYIAANNIDVFPLKTLTTPEDAGNFVKANYDLTGKVLYVSKDLMPAKSKVRTWGYHSTHTMPDTPGYLAFIDDNPEANWEHAARMIHVEDKEVDPATTVYDVMSPPDDVELSWNGGDQPVVGGDVQGQTFTSQSSSPQACTPDCNHYYALLISGGVKKETNYARYRNDIAFMYQTLTQKYGYPKDHIIVLMSDGTNPEKDQLTGYDSNNNPIYANSITDLDGGTASVDVKDVLATRTNVLSTLEYLRTTLTMDDNLFIFTTNHGGNIDPARNDVILYLWGTDEEGWILDEDFVNALPGSPQYPNTGVKSITMVMEQCFGGGFIDNFLDPAEPWTTPTRMIATAADWNEYSWGNAYSYQWISSEWLSRLSMQDAHDTAKEGDIYYTQYHKENPQFSAFPAPDAGTAQYLADCSVIPPTPSLTITDPGADTWYTGQPHKIKWEQVALAGTTMNIELWKGSNPGTMIPPIIATVTLSDTPTGSQEWTIPTTLAAGRDYWIKIYQPNVPDTFWRSTGSLTIIKTSGAGVGKLWINSTPVPTQPGNVGGARISIDDVWQIDPSTGTYNLTNSSIYLPAGSHDIGVEREDYYAVPVTNINVPQGGKTSVNFPLQPIINDCPPFGLMDISSMPDQYAKITIRNEQTNEVITGYFTDTKIELPRGTYTVTVEHNKYQTATQTGVVIRTPIVCGEELITPVVFDLQPLEEVKAKVKIVPKALNIANKGYFAAFVTLPKEYKASDVDAETVYCEGAKAVKLVRIKLFPYTFVAIFRSQDLDVTPADKVPLTVEGAIKKAGGNPVFSGSDTIKVIIKKGSPKDKIDDVMTLKDEKIFSQFNPG